jgi:hypothetical protein
MGTLKKKSLDEAQMKIREIKGILFKALDSRDIVKVKSEIMRAIKEL